MARSVGKRSKEKGKRYERRVASLFTEFTGAGFRKIPGSGGFNKTGGVVIAEHKFCGDIICDREDFDFFIEAKNRESYSQTAIVKSVKTCEFTQWWGKTVYEATGLELQPLLFFKPGTQDDFIGITNEACDLFGIFPILTVKFPAYAPYEIILSKVKKETVTVQMDFIPDCNWFEWKNFIKEVNPELFFREGRNGMRLREEKNDGTESGNKIGQIDKTQNNH